MASDKPSVAFVGVGRMGTNMALRLHDCGYQIASVYDTNMHMAMVTADRTGSSVAPNLAAVTASADVIFTVVTDDAAMSAIYLSDGDNLLMGAAGKLFINCATLSPAIHRRIDAVTSAAGADSLEACMASSIPQARDGTLYLMTAGSPAAQKRAAGPLADLGAVRRIGTTGQAASGQGAGQHGHEHKHRRPGGRSRVGRRARVGPRHGHGSFLANRGQFQGAGNRRSRHA